MNSKKLKSFKAKILIFLLFGSILTLTYEMILFFSSIVMEFNYLIQKKKNNLKIIAFGFMATLNILMLTVYSTPQNFNSLCKNIEAKRINMNLDNLDCWGAPYYLDNQDKSIWITEVVEGLSFSSNYVLWLLSLILLLLFIDFFGTSYKFSISSLLLLFLIAQDYGRWFFLIFATTIIFGVDREQNPVVLKNIKIISFLLILFGIILDIPVYLFQDKEF